MGWNKQMPWIVIVGWLQYFERPSSFKLRQATFAFVKLRARLFRLSLTSPPPPRPVKLNVLLLLCMIGKKGSPRNSNVL